MKRIVWNRSSATTKRRRRLPLMGATAALLLSATPAQAVPFAYVANRFDNTVSQYNVGVGGALTPLTPSLVGAPSTPVQVAVSPDGASVYVTSANGNTVSQYDVDAGGALTPKSPATVATGTGPQGIAISPSGASVYVTNLNGSTVSQFDVGAGGALTPKSPATVAAGPFPYGVAVSPDGASVYLANFQQSQSSGPSTVAQFDVGTGGALTPKSPATVATGNRPVGVAVSPNGASVYVTNLTSSSGSGDVFQYDVGAGGALAPKSPPTVATGTTPEAVAVSPDGTNAYVTNNGSNDVSQYNVGVGGALTPKSPATVAAGGSPVWMAVSPDGASVYVTNDSGNSVSQYTVGAGGALAPKSPATVAAGAGPTGIAVGPPTYRPYPHPQSAPLLAVSLVPVFKGQCGSPSNPANASHPPVVPAGATDSCSAPQPVSPNARTGSGGSGSATITVQTSPTTDVLLNLSDSDIETPSGADYDPTPGTVGQDLSAVFRIRFTDLNNCRPTPCSAPYSRLATGTDVDFGPVSIDCVQNGDPGAAPGSDCNVATSANAVDPGAVVAGAQAVWNVFRVRVNDSANKLFQQQGFFAQ
jgi:DNA-binding beta-propeller fold protein YncE